MKQNRKRSTRMSVVASHTMHVFGVIIVLFAMVIINMLASSSCTQMRKTIGEKERILSTLKNDRAREMARWDEMKRLDRLEAALVRHGLKMSYPKSIQIVRMDANGAPLLAQNSVKEARRRQGVTETASYQAATPTVRSSASASEPAPARLRSARRIRR